LLLAVTGFNSPAVYATDDPTDNQAAQSQVTEDQQEPSNNTGGDTESSKWGNYCHYRYLSPSPPLVKVWVPL
jgi:hypothetical protein